MGQVKIGPEFFKKVKKDYSSWRFAFARELCQNAIDAGASEIDVKIRLDSDDTIVEFYDNGCGMDKDTITERFLTLGGTHKLEGSVGGFGVAKSIIAFAHKSYKIRTNNIEAIGCGADYNINEAPFQKGTRFTINLGQSEDHIASMFRSFISKSQWNGDFYINDDLITDRMQKGYYRKSLEWCDIYTNNQFNSHALIRINGMCMFAVPIHVKKTVILELKGKSEDILTANRDSLQYKYQNMLMSFIEKLSSDSRSALKSDYVKTQLWSGRHLGGNEQATISLNTNAARAIPQSIGEVKNGEISRSEEEYEFQFMLRNETDLEIPDYLTPNNFSKWAEKLIKVWAGVIIELHELLEIGVKFGVGFNISEDDLAMYVDNEGYRYFLINPCTFTRFSSIKKNPRWGFTGEGKYAILEAAVHEITHCQGYAYHDEAFISQFGENMIKVMQNIKRFHKHFKVKLA